MELLKDAKPLEYTLGDVVLLVKPQATAYDRLHVVMATTPTEFIERMVRQMVVGWRGVTENGQPAAYSFDALKRLPEPDPKNSLLLKLGEFVQENTDVVKGATGAQEKNG